MISEVWNRLREISSEYFLSYFFATMASRLIASDAGPITGDLLEDSKYFKQFEALKSENSQKSSVQKITVSQTVWILHRHWHFLTRGRGMRTAVLGRRRTEDLIRVRPLQGWKRVVDRLTFVRSGPSSIVHLKVGFGRWAPSLDCQNFPKVDGVGRRTKAY